VKVCNLNTVLYADNVNIHISEKNHKSLEKIVKHELNKSITGYVLTNYVSIIPKAVSCSWATTTMLINHPISKQSTLKYLVVIFDDKLNWKTQNEKLMTQLSKSCGMLFKLKHHTNISVLKSVYFALFHSHLLSRYTLLYNRTRLIRHRFNSSIRLIRHFFVGPGRIPIFCVDFRSSNSSICLIRHLFLYLRSVLFG